MPGLSGLSNHRRERSCVGVTPPRPVGHFGSSSIVTCPSLRPTLWPSERREIKRPAWAFSSAGRMAAARSRNAFDAVRELRSMRRNHEAPGRTRPCLASFPPSRASARRTPSRSSPARPSSRAPAGHHQSRHRAAGFPDPGAHRRGRHPGAARRAPRLYPGERHPAPARGRVAPTCTGGSASKSSPDSVMILPGGKVTMFIAILMFGEPGRRDPLSGPRLSDLPLDDRVHRARRRFPCRSARRTASPSRRQRPCR